MARAFRPSSSVIYGSPERQALMDVGATLQDQFRQWSAEEIQADYRRQVSNAGIALEKERQNLSSFMDEHRNDPGSWRTEFQKNREQIRKAVLQGVRNPQARQAVELETNESFARWEGWLGESASKQAAYNTNADFNTHLDSFYKESRQYRDQTDMLAHLESGLTLLETGFNGGNLPVDKLPTREVAEVEKRNLTRHIVGNFLLQQALASGDDTLVDRANDVAPRSILDDQTEQPLFGPEELGDLKKRYDSAANAAKTEAGRARTERATGFDRAVTTALLKKQFNLPDDKGNPQNIRDLIINNDDLAPDRKTTLVNLFDKMAGGIGTATPTQHRTAYRYVSKQTQRLANGEIDFKRWQDVFDKYAPWLEESEFEKFYDEAIGVQGGKREPRDKVLAGFRTEMDSQATKALGPLFEDIEGIAYDPASKAPEPPELAEAVGQALKEFDDWYAAQEKPPDENAMRVQRNRILAAAYQRVQAGPPEPEPKKKGPGRLSRWWRGPGTIPVGQTATNKTTGEKVRWDGSAWQPIE